MIDGTKNSSRRHPHKALNARSVQTIRSNGRPRRVADGGGLYLFVAANGCKSWVLRTLVKGKRTDIGLGSLTLVSLADAREEAARLRRIARAGDDPLALRRQERRTVPTFEDAARQVHAAHAAGFRNEKHRKQWLASLSAVFTGFGAKQVNAITSADILAVLSPRWLERPETSRRVLQRITTVFLWCKAKGFCAGGIPTDGVTKALPKTRTSKSHHAALAYAQVPGFIQTLRESDSRESVRLAFEFAILTAARTSEVLGATWREIDLNAKTWTVPGTRMKAGVEHRVPLSDRSVEILKRAAEQSDGGPYVFPGRTKRKPLSNMVFLMALRRMRRMDLTTHGFRSSFRDWAAERTHAPRAVCEAALAHTLANKTEAAYARSDLFELRRDLMATWSAFATAKPADVVVMRA
jgi:integrase